MVTYIAFTAGVSKETVAKLRVAITESFNRGTEKITIFMSSTGGDVFEGLSIAGFIRALDVPVTTHNIGQTDSVANVIFAAGRRRYANSNASFLFHGVSQPINANLSECQLLELYTQTVRLREMISLNFSTYTGIPLADVSSLMVEGGNILSASQALSRNIIHEVREFVTPVGVQIVTIGNN